MKLPIVSTPTQDCGGEELTASANSKTHGSEGSEAGGALHEGMMEIVRQCLQQKDINDAYATWARGVRSVRKFGLNIPQKVQDYYQDMMVDKFEEKAARALVNVNSPGNAIAGNMNINPKK